jgi:integrase
MPLSTAGCSRLYWAAPHMASLRCMFHVLAQTGMRKSEVSLQETINLDRSHLLMSNIVWRIGSKMLDAPTAAQLRRLKTGDYALLTPPHSKADQFSPSTGARR